MSTLHTSKPGDPASPKNRVHSKKPLQENLAEHTHHLRQDTSVEEAADAELQYSTREEGVGHYDQCYWEAWDCV